MPGLLSSLKAKISPIAGGLLSKLKSNKILFQIIQTNAMRAIALGAGFIGSIWSSRCLGPEKLGISGIIIGTITPLVLLINLNQQAHFVRLYRTHKSEAERAELISVICTYRFTACCIAMVLAIPLLILGHFPPAWHLGLIAAFPYFFLIANTADWLLQSEEKVPAITQAVAVQSILGTTLYFLFFRPGMSAGADLVIQDISILTGTFIAWRAGLQGRKIRLFQWDKLKLIVPVVHGGRWLIATGIAYYIYTTADTFLVGWLHSLKELGIYRTSIALVAGVQAFTNFIPMLLYPRMLEWNKQGPHHLWQQQKKVLVYFALFAIGLSSSAFLLAPMGYHLIYGAAFQRGAYPFAILLTAKLMSLLNSTLNWGMMAQKKDRSLFKIMVCVAGFSLASNLLFIPRFGAFAASTTNLLSELFMFSLTVTLTRRHLRLDRALAENLKTQPAQPTP